VLQVLLDSQKCVHSRSYVAFNSFGQVNN